MVYFFLRYPIWFSFMYYYRKTYLINQQRIPQGVATLVVANHGNTFIDPIFVAAWQWRNLFFWARSNEFTSPLMAWFMRSVHVLPIFRIRDGKEHMHKNDQTFERSKQLWEQKQMLFIAPEGDCWAEKRLRTLRLGAAKLVFSFLTQAPDQKLYIQPAGMTFDTIGHGSGEAFLSYGEPFLANDFLPLYQQSPDEALQKLTDAFAVGIKAEMVHINNYEEAHQTVESLLYWHRTFEYAHSIFPLSAQDTPLRKMQAVVKAYESLDTNSQKCIQELLEAHQAARMSFKFLIPDYGLAHRNKSYLLPLLGLLALAPIALAGIVLGSAPVWLAQQLRDKYVKDDTFKSPVAMVLGSGLFIIWNIIMLIVSLVAGWGWIGAVGLLIASWKTYYIYTRWKWSASRIWQQRQYHNISQSTSPKVENLEQTFDALMNYLAKVGVPMRG
jgi:1-acyl-sn-glycerol-3-phosphate acyltransferase